MKKFFAIFAVAAMLFACEEPVPETTLSLDNEADATMTLSTEGGQKTVAFTTNAAWTAAADAAWITVAPASGVAGTALELTITVAANETYDNRAGKVTITADDKVAEIAIAQLQTDGLLIDEAYLNQEIGAEGGNIVVPVSANVDYEFSVAYSFDATLNEEEVEGECSWITLPGATRALETVENTIVVAPYTAADQLRYAVVLVSAEGVEHEVVITQYGPKSEIWAINLCDVFGDRVTTHAIAAATVNSMVSIAVLGEQVVVCSGDGRAPILLNKKTGAVEGELNTGGIEAKYVKNDDAGNLLFCTRTAYDPTTYYWTGDFDVYYMTSATAEPVKLCGSPARGPLGWQLVVRGDVTDDAIVAAPWEGIPGVTGDNMVLCWQITDGVAGEEFTLTINCDGLVSWGMAGYWETAPNNAPALAFHSANINDGGYFAAYFQNALYALNENLQTVMIFDCWANSSWADGAWAMGLNSMDARTIGGKTYLAVGSGHFFNEYSNGSHVFVLDVTNSAAPVLIKDHVLHNNMMIDAEAWLFASSVNATSNVVLEEGANGLILYAIENNNGTIEAQNIFF